MKDTPTLHLSTEPSRPPVAPDGASPTLIVAVAGEEKNVLEFFGSLHGGSGMALIVLSPFSELGLESLRGALPSTTPLAFAEAENHEPLRRDRVYLLPHADTFTYWGQSWRSVEGLDTAASGGVDRLLRALAEAHGERVVVVALGPVSPAFAYGIRQVRSHGGISITLDLLAQESPFPRRAEGSSDLLRRPGEISETLASYIAALEHRPDTELGSPEIAALIDRIRAREGIDLGSYREDWLRRFMRRRMLLRRIRTPLDEARSVGGNAPETVALIDDIQTPSAGFFENPEFWEAARRHVIEPLVASSETGSTLRFWAVGCGTGEEAFTLAMLLLEAAGAAGKKFELKVFATDQSDVSLQWARRAIYTPGATDGLSRERLNRFFVASEDGYRCAKELREAVVFARHDVLRDPPFAHLDLCSARILFPILQPNAQAVAFAKLEFALRPTGFLLVGPGESGRTYGPGFMAADEAQGIFRGLTLRIRTLSKMKGGTREPFGAPPEWRAESIFDRRELTGEMKRDLIELRATNARMAVSQEETTSLNEELQSLNEELRSSKEELQALNEELSTLNVQLHRQMKELSATTNDLSSLLSSTNLAVIFLDRTFRIRRVTPAAAQLIDLMPGDLGRPLSDLSKKFTDATLMADAAAVLEDLTPIEREITSDDGRAFLRSALPYRTVDQRVEGIVVLLIDITERKQNEAAVRESEEQHRLMFDSLKEYAIFLVDATGAIATWPASAERLLGFSKSEAIGQSLGIFFPPEDRAAGAVQTEMKQAREKGSVSHEGWRVRRDGTRFWANGTLSAVTDEHGMLRGYVKVVRDNSDLKAAEERLQAAKRKAEAANEAKDQFLATVSHELRTPLSSIVLWTNLLEDQAVIDPEQLREALVAIKRGADEQRELIEDLVDTARIAAGKLRLEIRQTDLAALAHLALKSISAAAEEKGVRFEEELGTDIGMVEVDRGRIKQVISNLLTNAVKFTPAGGTVYIRLRRMGDNIEFRVADTGQGFEASFAPLLFSRFEQAQGSAKRMHGGLGIGLAITRQLVEMHGGTIAGESAGLGRGATFTVVLPLPAIQRSETETEQEPPEKSRLVAQLQGREILLVEDSELTRKAITAVLNEAGAVVTPADSGASGLAEFHRHRPDIIISDLGLPGMDGFEFIRQVRRREEAENSPHTPALALTAFAGEHTSKKALESGFQYCLNKPIEPIELVRVVGGLKAAA